MEPLTLTCTLYSNELTLQQNQSIDDSWAKHFNLQRMLSHKFLRNLHLKFLEIFK